MTNARIPRERDYMVCEPCRDYIRLGHWERHLKSARHARNDAALKAMIERMGRAIG